MQSTSTSQNGRVRRSESEWRDLMQRFSRSGQSRAAFCRAEEISSSTFALWQRKLGTRSVPPQGTEDFVEFVSSQAPAGGWSIEIELPDGTLARLRS